MMMKTTRYRKPNLLVLLTFFVGFGVLTTSIVQAGETLNVAASEGTAVKPGGAQQRSVRWGLDLLAKLEAWGAELSEESDGRGVHLALPFGAKGPALRLSNTMPDEVKRCLLAGGDRRIGAFGDASPDAYVFLEKRW